MKKTMVFAGILTGLMVTVILLAFWQGDFRAEGRLLLALPWGVVTLVDLYVGFLLFAGWIWYREGNPVTSSVWVLSLLMLGNLLAGIYVLLALKRSGGSWPVFWMGKRYGNE